MTACTQWREELIDHALDQRASGALSAHLATCAGCSAALADWRARAGRLDSGVRALVAREPASTLRSRVLTGIDPKPALWGLMWGVRTAIAGAVLIAGIVLVMHGRALNREREQSTALASAGAGLSHWRAPTDVLLRTSGY